MATLSNQQDEFGPFRLDRPARLLFRNEDPIALAPKTFDLLAARRESRARDDSNGNHGDPLA